MPPYVTKLTKEVEVERTIRVKEIVEDGYNIHLSQKEFNLLVGILGNATSLGELWREMVKYQKT